ncbi:phosphodiester glycosidase family protein [Enterococcus sp. BWR-S5]|uniref:phosphodiester glycosidase family protein n=1 Tax=Enterococcus sp. BWR-S5 TaxID=2787714 RepID=UPI001923FBE6|nr:phosphodiester glycosidase family protein [Enterococcus sp. BWR-S5]MBL1225660.1 phosphodiester glycosidase family protein [Enterococcus sp. BWR-S5]
MRNVKQFFSKKYFWAICVSFSLSAAIAAVLLDTFVLTHKISVEAVSATVSSTEPTTSEATASETEETATEDTTDTEPVVTDTSYADDHLSISLTTTRKYDTDIYIVDVQVSDPEALKTAFAENSYGRNIKETTSQMAENNQAVLAINGDYYGFRNKGFVVRNGVLYRETANTGTEALVIDSNGDFSIVEEEQSSAQDLLDNGARQILSFGPGLLKDGEISVTEDEEVGQAMQSNPRTAIGQIGENHYVIVVADGRTEASEGLSLYELAEVFQDAGATTAYNLDGGGSSTLWFNGNVINQPTEKGSGERSVSDILYFN